MAHDNGDTAAAAAWTRFETLFTRVDANVLERIMQARRDGVPPSHLRVPMIVRFVDPDLDLTRAERLARRFVERGETVARVFPMTQAVAVDVPVGVALDVMSEHPTLAAEFDSDMGPG